MSSSVFRRGAMSSAVSFSNLPSFLGGLAVGFGFSILFLSFGYRNSYERNVNNREQIRFNIMTRKSDPNNISRSNIICLGDSLTEGGSWPSGK